MLAVPAPTVRAAGLEKAVTVVGAASDTACTIAAAVFTTETPLTRGGGAARHGARLLLLPATVFDAMLEPSCCRGGASINLAPTIGTMPNATATSLSTSLAALNVAHFGLATAMSDTQPSYVCSSCAIVKRADLFGAMLLAQPIFDSACIASSRRAKPSCPVRTAEPPCSNTIAAV